MTNEEKEKGERNVLSDEWQWQGVGHVREIKPRGRGARMNDLQSNALEAKLKVLSESIDAVTASINGTLSYLDRISNALERIADSAEVWCPMTPQVTTRGGEPKAIVTPLARRTKATIQDESRYQNTADSPPSGM